jgi:hypothetical protein
MYATYDVDWEYARIPPSRPGPAGRSRFRIASDPAVAFATPILPEQTVIDIKLRLAREKSAAKVSRQTGVPEDVVRRIRRNEAYADVTVAPEPPSENGHAAEPLRRPRQVVVTPTPEGFARQARKHLSLEDRRRLSALLAEPEP